MGKKFFTFLLLVVCISFFPSLSAYADSSYSTQWQYIFAGNDPYRPPSYYPPSLRYNGVDVSFTGMNRFCAVSGNSNGGYCIWSDSPTLIATYYETASWQYFTLSVPSGYTMYLGSYSNRYINNNPADGDETVAWYANGISIFGVYFSNSSVRWTICDNMFTIVDPDGNTLDEPIVTDNFSLKSTALTDFTIDNEISCTYQSGRYRVEYFVTPYSGTPSLDVSDAYYLISALSASRADSEEYGEYLETLFGRYPLVDSSDFRAILANVVTQSANTETSLLTPFSDMAFNFDLYNKIKSTAYNGYRGFDYGYFDYSNPRTSNFAVASFFANCKNMGQFTDVNCIYAVVFPDTGEYGSFPIAILGNTFRASDFFPDFVLPDIAPSMPSPDIIDDLPITPDGTDWTRYQCMMYLRTLLNQLSDNISFSVRVSTPALPDDDFSYSADDLSPFNFDESVPDIDVPEGVLPELVRPVSLFSDLWTNILDSLGIGSLVAFMMTLGLVAWFFYGRK